MELKVNELVIPQPPQFNYEEIKTWLTEQVKMYETLVYTDADIKQAKADKAKLNKLKKALNDERIRLEREYMEPFNKFKEQVNEVIAIIDNPIALIDKQVKEYDEKKKQEKEIEIREMFDGIDDRPEWLNLDQIFNPKWLNTTYSLKNILTEIEGYLDMIRSSLATLAELPDFSFEATEVYKRTLDLSGAISEGKRLAELQKRKEEAQAKQEEKPQLEIEVEPVGQWVNFSAFLTMAQAAELKDFFNRRGIQFKPI